MNTIHFKLAALTALLLHGSAHAQPRRPITPGDYDAWRSIQSPVLSDDGHWVAYALVPQAGEAFAVVKSIESGIEYRASIGVWPRWNSTPTIKFSSDGRFMLVATYPAADEGGQAKPASANSSNSAKRGMLVLELATGTVTRVSDVVTFQVPEEGPGWIAFLRSGQSPAELVLRDLSGGTERRFEDVVDYSLARDGKTLVYAVSSKSDGPDGVYAVEVGAASAPKPLLKGKGKYSKLTWDGGQTQLAFLGSSKLYLWKRFSGSASELPGCPDPSLEPSEQLGLRFSKDGQQIFFGCGQAPARKDLSPTETNKAIFELWRWQDRDIQPKQKADAARERNRAYMTVCHIAEKKSIQIENADLPEVAARGDGHWVLGIDDRPYRQSIDYDGPWRTQDVYLVNTLSGERKLALQKFRGTIALSPDGRHALFFDHSAWEAISIPDGKVTNLTSRLGVRFDDDTNDLPDTPPAYGAAGWTRDGRFVFLYDHYDIWQAALDGSSSQNVTRGAGGRQGISFRFALPGDSLDPDRPFLLRGENEKTKETGFFRREPGSEREPSRLIFGPRSYSLIGKAKHAEILLFTASTFTEFPDLQVAGPDFVTPRKVSAANPQQEELLWGSATLMTFRNSGGRRLNGLLYKPANFDPHKKYPMIVYIYERLSDRLHQFVPPRPEWGHAINISTYVSNGYLVLSPDIVYTVGSPGESALKCVLAAVAAVVKQGFVDESAIGIQGHSWGGYEVAYIVSHTNRFRAAEAGAVVVDMISSYGAIAYGRPRQLTYEKNQSRIGGTLWEFPNRFIDNSPIFVVDRITTPVLILHNDADPNTPFAGAIEFYLALRRLRKEVYLLNYPGEGHDLENWAHGKDFAIRMQQFFDHHLKGAQAPEWMAAGIPSVEPR